MSEQLGYGARIRKGAVALLVIAVALLSVSRLMADWTTNVPFTYVTNLIGGTPIPLGGYTFGSKFTIGSDAVAVTQLGFCGPRQQRTRRGPPRGNLGYEWYVVGFCDGPGRDGRRADKRFSLGVAEHAACPVRCPELYAGRVFRNASAG